MWYWMSSYDASSGSVSSNRRTSSLGTLLAIDFHSSPAVVAQAPAVVLERSSVFRNQVVIPKEVRERIDLRGSGNASRGEGRRDHGRAGGAARRCEAS